MSAQEPLPVGGITSAYEQKCCRVGKKLDISRLFQPVIVGSKTQQPVETCTRSKQTKPISQGGKKS